MNTPVKHALDKLDHILPLVTGLESLSEADTRIYCMLLKSYAENGQALLKQDIQTQFPNPELALKNIAEKKLIVLDGEGNPVGAYPFTSEEREHRVHINNITAHCMCALDALAVSPMFNKPTVIDSVCRATGELIHIEQNGTDLTDGTLDAWFGINWGAAESDTVCAASLCTEMLFLRNESIARGWLAEQAETREIFDLPSAVDFAAGFFVPLAEQCRLNA